jgi:hypothetical protein
MGEIITVDNVQLFMFPERPPLRPIHEYQLREYYQGDFHTAIIKLLTNQFPKNETVSYCSEPLSFPKVIYVDKTNRLTDSKNPEKTERLLKQAISSRQQFIDYLKEKQIMDNPNVTEGKVYITALNENDFITMKQEFKQCTNLQYFVPLSTFRVYDEVGHQNLLLFNKDDKRVTWIEPQYENVEYYKQTAPLITDIVNRLLNLFELTTENYSIELPTKPCPQSVTKDDNCMFWTLMLTFYLMLNPKSTIDEVSSAVLKKFPTKELLSQHIQNFKVGAYNLMNAGGGKRKRRRTRRHKSVRKTKRRNK